MSSSSGDPEVKALRKQHTFSSELEEKEPMPDSHLLRSNSLMNKHTLPNVKPANSNSMLANNHNLSYGNNLSGLANEKTESHQTNFKLHRTDEVENLTAEIQRDNLTSDNSQNLRRTTEHENLYETVNNE